MYSPFLDISLISLAIRISWAKQMSVDLVLENAKIYFRDSIVRAGLAIDGEKIVRVAKETNLPHACKKIDLGGRLVLPGIIDAHVHMRDQDLEYKEDFFTGTCAAASGGITTVLDMPNNVPVTMSVDSLEKRAEIAARRSVVNVAFYSAFPENLKEMEDIVKWGAKGFKLFLSKRIGGLDPEDDETLLQGLRRAARLGVPVLIHAEDKELLESKSRELKRKGRCDVAAYLEAHSVSAEAKAVMRATELSRMSGAHVYICHVSAERSVGIISSAKHAGINVTCEVTPHHLFLSSHELEALGYIALTNPPLRSERDQQSLWLNLKRGIVDIVASDHAPHALHEKERNSVWEVSPGFPGLETMVPLMLTQVNKRRLALSELVRITSERPAEIFRIEGRGVLDEGWFADFIVVDMKEEWKIDSSKFYSKAKFSPFNGWAAKGRVVKTFVNGRLVMDEGEIAGKPGGGKIIR